MVMLCASSLLSATGSNSHRWYKYGGFFYMAIFVVVSECNSVPGCCAKRGSSYDEMWLVYIFRYWRHIRYELTARGWHETNTENLNTECGAQIYLREPFRVTEIFSPPCTQFFIRLIKCCCRFCCRYSQRSQVSWHYPLIYSERAFHTPVWQLQTFAVLRK